MCICCSFFLTPLNNFEHHTNNVQLQTLRPVRWNKLIVTTTTMAASYEDMSDSDDDEEECRVCRGPAEEG